MKRGPKPQSEAQLRLTGTYRPGRGVNPVGVKTRPPTCPSFLDAEGRKEWRRVVALLADARMICEMDRAPLALYAQSWSEYVESLALVKQQGRTITSDRGQPMTSPAWRQMQDSWQRCLKSAREIGFTVGSRQTISGVRSLSKKDEQDEKMFGA